MEQQIMMRIDARVLLSGLLCFFCLFMTGCGRHEMQKVKSYVDKVKQQPADPIEPIPKFQVYTPYAYQADPLRSPFKAVVARPDVVEKGPDLDRPREPLESFPLDALDMVGVLSKNQSIWALILTPDGTIHRVAEGSYMGKNFGRVTKISESKIDIMESVRDKKTGGWLKRRADLTLREQ